MTEEIDSYFLEGAPSVSQPLEESASSSEIENPPDDGAGRWVRFKLAWARTRTWSITYTTLVAVIGTLLMGYSLGYSSPALPDLKTSDPDTSFNETTHQDIFSALIPIGGLTGAVFGGWLVDLLGRKLALMLTTLPFTFGWLLIVLSRATNGVAFRPIIYVGRFLTGVGCGYASVCVPLIISESSPSSLRGFFSAFTQLAVTIGIFLVYAIGALEVVTYYWLALVPLMILPFYVILMIPLRDTPCWLVSKGRRLQAGISLLWLRGNRCNIVKEQKLIERSIDTSNDVGLLRGLLELRKKANFHPLLISIALMLFQQFSGINAIIFYSEEIVERIGGISNPRVVSTLAVGGVQVIATIFGVILADLAGRRKLLIVGALTMSASMATLGLYYFFNSEPFCNPDEDSSKCKDNLTWLAIVSLMVYIIGFSIAWGALPWVITSEIIPLEIRGVGVGIATFINWTSAAIVTGTFKEYVKPVKIWGAFWSFSVVMLLAFFFTLVFVPETKGKTLEEVEKLFKKTRRRSEHSRSIECNTI